MECGDVNTPATIQCAITLFQRFIYAAFTLVGFLAVILIIIAGIRYITAGGDNKQLEGARKMITYAVIGLFIVLFSVFIVNIISVITGVTCIQHFGFTNCQ